MNAVFLKWKYSTVHQQERDSCLCRFLVDWVQFWFLPLEFREFGHISTSTAAELL